VYLDTCGALMGGQPPTIPVLRELFLNQRLGPLSVLITNFAEPCPNLDASAVTSLVAKMSVSDTIAEKKAPSNSNSEAHLLKWAQLIGLWSYANGNYETWLKYFREFLAQDVLQDLTGHYSRFATEFVINFAGQLLPWWRLVALPGSRSEYFAEKHALWKAVMEGEKTYEAIGHSSYAALRAVLFTMELLPRDGAWHHFYFNDKIDGIALADAIKAASLIRTFYESQW